MEEDSTINHPLHYGGDTTYEAIKVIQAWDLDFCLGNAVKYICRAEKKGNTLEDLKKAAWYLARAIESREASPSQKRLLSREKQEYWGIADGDSMIHRWGKKDGYAACGIQLIGLGYVQAVPDGAIMDSERVCLRCQNAMTATAEG